MTLSSLIVAVGDAGSAEAGGSLGWEFLVRLLLLLALAVVLGTVAERLKQSAIVGYLLAGAIVGPHGMGWVARGEVVDVIAEIGVAMLLFTVGLEFSIKRLLAMGRTVLLGGTLQVVVVALATAGVAMGFGVGARGAAVIGLIVAMGSTACVIRLLADRMAIESPWGRGAVGILLLQDAAVLPATLLAGALASGGGVGEVLLGMGKTVGVLVLMVGVFFLVFNVIVPKALRLQQYTGNRELPILLAAIAGLGSATVAHGLGVSPAIGAFVAGVLLAESVYSVQIRSDIQPLKTIMLTLFFGSIGMLSNPAWAAQNAPLLLGVTLAVLVGKTALTAALLRMIGAGTPVALAAALALAEVGEFGFVLAQIGRGTILADGVFNLLVSVTMLTLICSPWLVALAAKVSVWLPGAQAGRAAPIVPYDATHAPPKAGEEACLDAVAPEVAKPVLIIGFGPAGQGVAEGLMNTCPKRIRVVDLSPRSEARARDYGLHFQLGDAQQQDVLEHAGAHEASIIVITLPDPMVARGIVHLARHINPGARIYVRSRYHVATQELVLAGADVVVDEETEMGQRLASQIVVTLAKQAAAGPRPASVSVREPATAAAAV
jgi:CPA2 family monovalent cation:H+ antiporter-2